MVEKIEEQYVEPQAAEAIKILEGKGYKVGLLAGSSGNPAEGKQAVVFDYPQWKQGKPLFDEAVLRQLKSGGFEMYRGAMPAGTVGFEFSTEKGNEQAKWNELAELLPKIKK